MESLSKETISELVDSTFIFKSLDAPIREAYHAVDVLASTYIAPPQAVLLARALAEERHADFPLITPEEVTACFAKDVCHRDTEFTEIF